MSSKRTIWTYFLPIALSLSSEFLFAQDNKPDQKLEKHTATSSLQFKQVDGKEHTIIDNHRFSIVYTCDSSGCFNLVLHENFFSDVEEGAEGGKAIVNVLAWRRDKPEVILWKAKLHADVGKAHEDFYETTLYGCCGDPDRKTYLSLASGNSIFESCEYEPLKVEIPNTRTERYITYSCTTGGNNARDPHFGRLQYSDGSRVLETVTIREPSFHQPPETSLRTPKQADSKAIQLWAHNGDQSGKGASGFSVVLRFEEGELVIPVENDRLDIHKAVLPSGFKFTQ